MNKLINALPSIIAIGLVGYWAYDQLPKGTSAATKSAISGLNRTMPNSEEWQVTSVADGDTMTVQRGTEKKKIRFCGIDAPEVKHPGQPGQPFGEQAKDKLKSLVAAANGKVLIMSVESDRYGRTVAEVFVRNGAGDISFQEEILKDGLAYYYRQYASSCPNRSAFEEAEKLAIAAKAGVWSQSGLEKPWDYRKRFR